MGTGGFLFFWKRSLVTGFQLLSLVNISPKPRSEFWSGESQEGCKSRQTSPRICRGRQTSLWQKKKNVFYFVGELGGGRLTGQLSRIWGGNSPAAFGFVSPGPEEGGDGTLVAWQKKLFCSDMRLITWHVVLPWQEISPKKQQQKQKKNNNNPKKKPLCFLSDQEDVLRDGWSVELGGSSDPDGLCGLVPQVRCYCTADWSDWSEVKSGFAAVVRQGGTVCRGELRRKRQVEMFKMFSGNISVCSAFDINCDF